MAITKLADIDPTLPTDDDNISEGASRMRELREALLNQFPGLAQTLDNTVTDAWLNQLAVKLQVTGGLLDATNTRIINVDEGVNAHDAATYGQVSTIETRLNSLENRVAALEAAAQA